MLLFGALLWSELWLLYELRLYFVEIVEEKKMGTIELENKNERLLFFF